MQGVPHLSAPYVGGHWDGILILWPQGSFPRGGFMNLIAAPVAWKYTPLPPCFCIPSRLNFRLLSKTCFTVWKFLSKLRFELPYHPPTPLLGIYPQNKKTLFQKDVCTTQFITVQELRVGIYLDVQQQIMKMCHVYTMEYYKALRNDAIMQSTVIWMELEDIVK